MKTSKQVRECPSCRAPVCSCGDREHIHYHCTHLMEIFMPETPQHNLNFNRYYQKISYKELLDSVREEYKGCYCVCHSSVSSCPVCEHCKPAVEMAVVNMKNKYKGIIEDLKSDYDSLEDHGGNFQQCNGYNFAVKAHNKKIAEVLKRIGRF